MAAATATFALRACPCLHVNGIRILPIVPRVLAAAALALVSMAAPALADCPGAEPACPYAGSLQIGQRGEGVLRFPQAVAVGADGAIYVGDQASHTVQVFSASGEFLRQLGVAGRRPGELSSVGGVAVAADNSVVVADGSNRIHRFGADGALLNSFGRAGTEGAGEFRFGAGGGNDAGAGGGIAVGGDFVYVADTGNDRIQRFPLGGGPGNVIVPPGRLDTPMGLAVRGSRVTVADDRNHRLVVFDTGGRFLRTVGAGPGPMPGQLSNPYDVASDAAGRLFVADDLNHRIVRFSAPPSYPYKARFGSYGTGAGQLAYPRGIAVDANGLIYVANTGNDRIEVFDRGGRIIRSIGRSGRASGQFDGPIGVAADASGTRAVTDSVNGRVQLLNPDGSVATVWGSPAPGPTLLPSPVAVAFDAGGNAYVLDQRRSRIAVFERTSGRLVRTIGAPGRGPGRLLAPSALAIDAAGRLSVADTGNERIARFATGGAYFGAVTDVGPIRGIAVTPDGSRTYTSDSAARIRVWDGAGELAGEFGGRGSKLGKLNSPAQMTLDAAGNLWVADRGNNRVQQFGPEGERLLTMGNRGIGAGQFIKPSGVSIDCRGTLTVTDSDNNRVQQFALTAPAVAPCTALPALGHPPAPKLPTLPAPVGPQLTLRPLRTAGVLGRRGLPIRVGCDTGCRATATATLTPRAAPRRGRRAVTVSMRRVRRTIPAGESAVVRLSVSRAGARRLRRALRGRRGLVANLEISATAVAGQPTVRTERLRVSG
jgi:tripartite motif-containing protein 71